MRDERAEMTRGTTGRVGLVSVDGRTAEMLGRWWRREIAPIWPDGEAPEVVIIEPEALLVDAGEAGAGGVLRQVDAACVVIDCQTPEATARRVCAAVVELLGGVGESAAGAVCVLPGSLAHLGADLRSLGMLVHHDGRGRGCLGSLLMGLVDRRRAMHDTHTELRARRAAQGQVHSLVTQIDSELMLAAKLQREAMRSDEVRIPNLQIGVLWRPAWYVSGDVYKIVRVDEQHAGVIVADAMGHGVSAAMYSMLIASATSFKGPPVAGAPTGTPGYRLIPPSECMDRLNVLLQSPESESTRFATAAAALINVRSGRVQLCSAGHPTALVISPRGEVARLESTGTVLGIVEDLSYEQIEADLPAGCTLAIFTDGLEEVLCQDGREHPGETIAQRAEAFVIDLVRRHDDPRAAIDALERYLDTRPGSLRPSDDSTLILLKRAG